MGQLDSPPWVELQRYWLDNAVVKSAGTHSEQSRRLSEREREQDAETDGGVEN